VKSSPVVMNARPLAGLAAFVRVAETGSSGAYAAVAHPLLPTSDQMLDRGEGPLHPGEEGV